MTGPVTADDEGLHFPDAPPPSGEVLFDDQPIWTFECRPGTGSVVAWPPNMRQWLDGVSRVRVRTADTEHDLGEVRFGTGTERIRFVDEQGVGIVVDKWGILQRPFHLRGGGVLDHMVGVAQRIVEVTERAVGIRPWMAFGTLLGAVREGRAIAHDADIDLAYLSERESPAEMMAELYAIRRALVRDGLRVINKSGSFITVMFTAPDGSQASIDLYTVFHLGDLLYETATVRAPVPRSAILPLGELPFEGHLLPAPADPDALLAASYGANWRTPDPGFKHRPGPEVTERFDAWFGTVMRERRPWEVFWRDTAPELDRGPSSFAAWVAGRLPPGASVVDAGCGDGTDALAWAAAGWPVTGVDYARGAARDAVRRAAEAGLSARFSVVNFLDARDAVTAAAQLRAELPAPRVVTAGHLLDAIPPASRDAFWGFADIVLRGGGLLLAAYDELLGPLPDPRPRFHETAGIRFRIDTADVRSAVARHGGVVRTLRAGPVTGRGGHDPLRRPWRLEAHWPSTGPSPSG